LLITFQPNLPRIDGLCQNFLGSVEDEATYADENVQKLRRAQRLPLGLGKPSSIGYSGFVTTSQEWGVTHGSYP
jgi:hypothetical protein